jgi:large subunit ribosomal protein L14
MQAVKSKITKGLNTGSFIETCDNSGAKLIRIVSIKGSKSVEGRKPRCGISDLVLASVRKGSPDMRKQVVFAVIVRQKKEYRRPDGSRIKFEDNAAVVLKDDKGNPKGTIFKGPIAKEVCERWPGIAKVASIIV